MAYKDGFVIEYTNQGRRVSCYKCVYFDKGDKSCRKTGVYVPDVAREKWKKCPYFELDDDYDTEEMRVKAARGRSLYKKKNVSSPGKRKPEKRSSEKRQPIANPRPTRSSSQPIANPKPTRSSKKKKLDGITEIASVGTKVTSPKYGRGKVVGVEGNWVTVAFVKDAKRIRFDIVSALTNGSLSI